MAQNPSHTYTSPGTFTWTLSATANGVSCTRTGTVTISVLAYDLNCYDDTGRSRICVNSLTGAWKWTVLRGAGIGTYSGTGSVTWVNGVLILTSQAGEPWRLSVKYLDRDHKASGSFTYPVKRVTSVCADSNTTNNPPGGC